MVWHFSKQYFDQGYSIICTESNISGMEKGLPKNYSITQARKHCLKSPKINFSKL